MSRRSWISTAGVPSSRRSVSVSIDRVALPMEEPIEAPPVPVNPPWVAAVMATAPPHPPEVQAVLDEQNQGDAPKVARNFHLAYAVTVTLHDAEGESIHTIRYGRMIAPALTSHRGARKLVVVDGGVR